jgi:hypothetical protein
MTLPSFILIGAAKAGTSSVYSYLAQHPDIFMCTPKEPNFFAFEGQRLNFAGPGDVIINRASITTLDSYEACFRSGSGKLARGEASTLYLYDPHAAACIRRYTPDVKLIAILRDPAERAYSSYLHLVRDGREPLSTFEAALLAEESRILANWEHLWHYRRLGFYARQLQRYFDVFDVAQLAVYTYDEFQRDPLQVLRQIFEFLELRSDFRPDLSVRHEVSGVARWPLLNRLMKRPGMLKSVGKRFVSRPLRARVYAAVMKYNIVTHRPPLAPETRADLVAAYREDIDRLQTMIGRDLSAWQRCAR